MGRPKASLPVGDTTLLRYVIERLRPGVDDVIVAGGPDPGIEGTRWVADRAPSRGPLSGLAAGLGVARGLGAWVVATDHPDVAVALGQLLFEALDGVDAAVPRIAGRPQPTCAAYRATLAPQVNALLDRGVRSMRALLDQVRVRYLDETALFDIDPELRSFRNLNTPEEYRRWHRQR